MTEQNQSRFEFVTVASARAKQLLNGCTPKMEGSSKPARRAVQEVTAGLVQGTHAVDDVQEG
jgi:DNA-directed RNA polymerase omega subunit